MQQSYAEAVRYLESLHRFGIHLGLERMEAILEKLGNPQDSLKVIHVGGTNGKGSVVAILSSVLKEAGYTVGIYTSPHLVDYTERFQINFEAISQEDFAAQVEKVRPVVEEVRKGSLGEPTEFEILTAMAFNYFKEKNVNYLVLEVGLGGRLDATNVVKAPLATIITNVELEHTAQLGETIEKIAAEKAGIIKPGVPVITAASGPALEVIQQVAKEKNALIFPFSAERFKLKNSNLEGVVMIDKTYRELHLSLLGSHQFQNGAIVVKTCEVLMNKGVTLFKDYYKRGFKKAFWPGRFEIVRQEPIVILDGAHNPAAAKALAAATKHLLKERPVTLVLGVLEDKDYSSMLQELVPVATRIIATAPEIPRALKPEALAQAISALGKEAIIKETIAEAVEEALRITPAQETVLITGSLYTVGNARKLLVQS